MATKEFDLQTINWIWREWVSGRSQLALCRDLGTYNVRIGNVINTRGGVAPRPRRRSSRQLSPAEREEISRGISQGKTDRQIASGLSRHHTTVWREISRNGGRERYRAVAADGAAVNRSGRPQPCKMGLCPELTAAVVAKLKKNWSPRQIDAWLKITYPDRPMMHVSHETIYKTLFIQTRGVLRKELTEHLRTGRPARKPNAHAKSNYAHRPLLDGISISERPAEAEDRAVPGHWEGDLILGARHKSRIATLVERHSRFVMLVKLDAGDTRTVTEALAAKMLELPDQLKRSLTWDRGSEMGEHQRFTNKTGLKVYFCDPRSPWQRGTNENTNKLLRQYFPKGTDLSVHSQEHLDAVAQELNERPRQTLDWKTPAAKLEEALR